MFCVLLIALVGSAAAAPKRKVKPKKGPPTINLQAGQIAKAVPKYSPKATKQEAVQKMEELIHLIARTNRDNLSANNSLVRTAMDIRDDIGERERTLSMSAIVKAWDAAYTYGALGNHHFQGIATKGRFDGESLVFENIVPAEVLPECTGYIGNLRLVPKSMLRKKGAPLSEQDKAFEIGLRQIMRESKSLAKMREIQKSKVGHLAMSKAEHDARWQAEVNSIEGSLSMLPNVQLHAQKMGSPSKLNGYRYKLRVEASNISRHPTEIEIISTMVGYSDNGNKLYEMRRDKRVLRMRRSQVDVFHLQTPNVNTFKKPLIKFDPKRSQKVIYRGFTVVARQNGEIIAAIGSDVRMEKVAIGEYSSPSVITPASRAGGTKPPPPAVPAESGYSLIQFPTPGDLALGTNGTVASSAPSGTIGLMSDGKRMYHLNSDGALWIYESHSFESSSQKLGEVFSGRYAHSLFSDGTHYYIHLSQPALQFEGDVIVKFASVKDLMSGENGVALSKAAPGSAALLADGKAYYKLHHGNVNNTVLSSNALEDVAQNTKGKFGFEGKLFCDKQHTGAFSDGTHYYLQVPAGVFK